MIFSHSSFSILYSFADHQNSLPFFYSSSSTLPFLSYLALKSTPRRSVLSPSSALTLPRIKRPTSTFDSYWRVHMVGGQFARSPHPIVGIENLNGTHERERERAPLVSNRRFEFLKYIPGSPPVSLLAFCFVPFLIERKIGSSCL